MAGKFTVYVAKDDGWVLASGTAEFRQADVAAEVAWWNARMHGNAIVNDPNGCQVYEARWDGRNMVTSGPLARA